MPLALPCPDLHLHCILIFQIFQFESYITAIYSPSATDPNGTESTTTNVYIGDCLGGLTTLNGPLEPPATGSFARDGGEEGAQTPGFELTMHRKRFRNFGITKLILVQSLGALLSLSWDEKVLVLCRAPASMLLRSVRITASMHLLCALYSPPMHPLCSHYVPIRPGQTLM